MKYLIISAIKIYQRTISPDHGLFKARFPYGFCRFYPSCSEYAMQAINDKGVLRGAGAAIVRIIKCNPFASPGLDPVIKNQHNP